MVHSVPVSKFVIDCRGTALNASDFQKGKRYFKRLNNNKNYKILVAWTQVLIILIFILEVLDSKLSWDITYHLSVIFLPSECSAIRRNRPRLLFPTSFKLTERAHTPLIFVAK